MLNCLKSDLYKAFKGKTFLVLSIIIAGYALLTVGMLIGLSVLASEIGDGIMSRIIDGKSSILIMMANVVPVLLTGVFTAIFICSEYAYGTMRNLVSKSISRTKIFFSKFIVCCIVGVIFLLIFFISSLLGGLIIGYGGPFTGTEFLEILSKFLFALFITVAFISVFSFFSFLIRSTGGAIAVNLIIVYVIPIILTILNVIILVTSEGATTSSFIDNIWLGSLLNQIISASWPDNLPLSSIFSMLAGGGGGLVLSEIWWRVLLTSLAYLVVPGVFAYTLFIKQDIK